MLFGFYVRMFRLLYQRKDNTGWSILMLESTKSKVKYQIKFEIFKVKFSFYLCENQTECLAIKYSDVMLK